MTNRRLFLGTVATCAVAALAMNDRAEAALVEMQAGVGGTGSAGGGQDTGATSPPRGQSNPNMTTGTTPTRRRRRRRPRRRANRAT